MAEKATAGNVYEFPVNQTLLAEASKLREERNILKQRLEKIEGSRNSVSPTVYNKVKQDYCVRFKQVTDQLVAKKQDIDRELSTLYQTRDKLQNNLKNHKEMLEETEFRFHLGEFAESEFQQQARTHQEKITKFESILNGVLSNIQRYEKLFENEEELFAEAPEAPGIRDSSATVEGPLTIDEEESEEDYFVHEARQGPPEWTETTKPQLGGHPAGNVPRLVLAAGPEDVGMIFPIEGILTFGRSQSNQVVVMDAKASRQHAEIRVQGTECVLTDLNSSNGTCVNGERVKEHVLTTGDQIQIGDFIYRFES